MAHQNLWLLVLTMHEFATIVADPPWDQKGGALAGGVGEGFKFDGPIKSRDLPYPTMTLDAIKALTVPAADNAHLYLWTTNRYLRDAFDVITAWGFRYSTTLVWAKNPIGAGLGGAHGIATEFCLFARRGTLPAIGRTKTNWWNWKRSYDERGKPRHSAKPGAFFEMVEAVSPGPYLEMFARDPRLGWSSWGNEFENDVEVA